ncbi:MAG: hypothetical protein ACLR1E_03210 [Coprococcus sp.]
MIDFTDIIGHEDIIRHFKSSIELGKISQGYIINGETGSGKKDPYQGVGQDSPV